MDDPPADSGTVYYESLFNNSKSIMLLIDPDDGSIVDANKMAISYYGYSYEELIQMKIQEINTLSDDQVKQEMDHARTERRNYFLFKHRLANGQVQDVEVYSNPVVIDNKVLLYSIIHDVTKQVLLERDNQKLVENSIEALGILGSGVAHDYNNILQAMLGNIELLKLEKSLSNQANMLIGDLFDSVMKAKDITQTLQIFSKGGILIKKPHSLHKILSSSISFVQGGSDIRFIIEIDESLPLVHVDVTQIGRVFNNLLLNAVQAMPQGGEILVQASPETIDECTELVPGDYVCILIKDEGIGIEAKEIKKVFQPYYSTKKDGRGMGLSAVKAIISNHKGRITLQSEQGWGTECRVYLPVMSNDEYHDPEIGDIQLPGGIILLLDDKKDIHKSMKPIFKELGYDLISSYTGRETMELYEKMKQEDRPPEIVILDLTIPGGLGGADIVASIKEIDSSQVVIASSGYSTLPIMTKYSSYGFDGALVKPYDINSLKKELHLVLNAKDAN